MHNISNFVKMDSQNKPQETFASTLEVKKDSNLIKDINNIENTVKTLDLSNTYGKKKGMIYW